MTTVNGIYRKEESTTWSKNNIERNSHDDDLRMLSFGPTMKSSEEMNNPTASNVVSLDHDIDFGKSPSSKNGPRRVVKAIRPPMSAPSILRNGEQ